MRNHTVDALNKVIIPADAVFGSTPNVLWINSACNYNKFTLNLKPHNHAFFELHFLISGNFVYRFNDGDIRVGDSSLILISPHTIHCIPDQSPEFQKITVAFDVPEGQLREILQAKNKTVIPLDSDMLDSLDFIIRKAKNKTVCSETMIKIRLNEIIYAIAESVGARPTVASEAYDTRLIKAKKFIEDNQHIFLTCDEVASYCNLSSKQLGRLFLQYENTSLLAFIHGQKIETAKQMIVDTDELFDTISQRLGFSSVNYFGKFFMKHTGITPGDFRKKFDNSETFEESF